MNIAIFTDTFMPKFDGIVTSILNTTNELIRRGHRVLIVAPRIRKNQEDIIKKYNPKIEVLLIRGVDALFYPDFKLTHPATPWIVKRLKEFGANIIHFHTQFTMGLEAIVTAKILKLPLVSTFHTYFSEPEYLKIVKLDRFSFLVCLGWAYTNFFHERCDITISPSKFTAEELKRKGMKGKVVVISNGITLRNPKTLTAKDRENIREKYGLREKNMLFVGRVSQEKSIDILIKASSIVLKRYEDVSLQIVGDGPFMEKAQEMAKEEGIEEKVIFSGYLPHEDLLNSGIFEYSRFFVTASKSENQPMTIIEACMMGLPVIGVNARGVPEMIDENGFVAEPDNYEEIASYMEKLIADDLLLSKMKEKSIEMGKRYDIRKTTQKMLELYQSLIN